MAYHFIAGAYSVKVVNLETGEVSDLPTPATYQRPNDSPTDERVYRLADCELSITIELSPENASRLWWIIMRPQYWLWRRYRQTLN